MATADHTQTLAWLASLTPAATPAPDDAPDQDLFEAYRTRLQHHIEAEASATQFKFAKMKLRRTFKAQGLDFGSGWEPLWEACVRLALALHDARRPAPGDDLTASELEQLHTRYPVTRLLGCFDPAHDVVFRAYDDGTCGFSDASIGAFLVAWALTHRAPETLDTRPAVTQLLLELIGHRLAAWRAMAWGDAGPAQLARWTGPDGLEFVGLPPGRFWMGSTRDTDDPRHDPDAAREEFPGGEVELTRRCWIARHPVTRAQYRRFLDATSRAAPDSWDQTHPNLVGPNKPVVGVTWYDAAAYCDWLTNTGLLPPGLRADLPSEAQWERAARGTDGRKHPWGAAAPSERLAWYNKTAPAPIGARPDGASPAGCEDMAGNVLEWCRDTWSSDLTHTQNTPDPCNVVDAATRTRVVRGGAWTYGIRYLRCASRMGHYPHEQRDCLGFRVVCVFDGTR